MNVRIAIDLPDGCSAEFVESPLVTRTTNCRDEARQILDRTYADAVRWLNGPDRKPGGGLA